MDELFNQKQLRYDAIKISMDFGQDRTRVTINPLFSDFEGNFDINLHSFFTFPLSVSTLLEDFSFIPEIPMDCDKKRILTVDLGCWLKYSKTCPYCNLSSREFQDFTENNSNTIQSNLPKGVDYFVFCVLHLAVRITIFEFFIIDLNRELTIRNFMPISD